MMKFVLNNRFIVGDSGSSCSFSYVELTLRKFLKTKEQAKENSLDFIEWHFLHPDHETDFTKKAAENFKTRVIFMIAAITVSGSLWCRREDSGFQKSAKLKKMQSSASE
jgi:hypothetical protein